MGLKLVANIFTEIIIYEIRTRGKKCMLFNISKPRLEYQVLLNILYEDIRSEFIH